MRQAARLRRTLTGWAQNSRLLALAFVFVASACGSAEAPASGVSPPAGSPTTALAQAATAGPGSSNHTVYAARGIGCAECHPCGKRDPSGHAVEWMDAASAGFHAYAANRDLGACRTCHGAALDGVGGTTTISCARCHGTGWRTGCTGCHGGDGGDTSGAPPRTVWGGAADPVRVGAHAAHLGASHGLSAAVACATCHAVPTDALSPGHADGATADVALTGLAASDGAAASWTRASATCTTYCHGATLGGGANKTPAWTDASGAARACDACHGAPPPAPHAQRTDCGTCHAGYTSATVNVATHVDGTVNVVALACTTCHGEAGRASVAGADVNQAAAPPVDTGGATAGARVGAHLAHVNRSALMPALACAVCHGALDGTHPSGGAAKIAFGGVAGAGSSYANGTCTTYCHAQGGATPAPSWTGPAMTCGSCHGAPPPAPHSQSTACGSCHAGYTATSVNAATHVNGAVDVTNLTCTSCHGKAGQAATAAAPLNAAPPADTAGAATGRRVGAHQKHLTGGTYANALSCATCHASVASYGTGHADGTRNVGFTGAANANLQRGTWTAGTGTAAGSCSATWCHGAVITRAGGAVGGTQTTPSWTGAVTSCTACHAVVATSLSGRHTSVSNHRRYACSTCHGAGYTATITSNVATGTAVNKATHVDGARTIVTVASGTGIRTWNPTTRTCTASCHGSETW